MYIRNWSSCSCWTVAPGNGGNIQCGLHSWTDFTLPAVSWPMVSHLCTDPRPSSTVWASTLFTVFVSLCTLRLDLLAESNTTAAAEPPSLVTHTLDNTIYFFSGRSSVVVTVWQAVAVVRAVCCLAAWLVIACLNDYDRLDGETLVFFVVKLCFRLQSTASTALVRTLWKMEAAVELQYSLSERWWWYLPSRVVQFWCIKWTHNTYKHIHTYMHTYLCWVLLISILKLCMYVCMYVCVYVRTCVFNCF